jgi:magnesium chelatase family protein
MASEVAIVGGGSSPVPGEISLSHNGILFLDELPEFSRSVIEVLRQPLEDKHITIARAKYSVEYPSNFMLVASMNPCPCGYLGHPTKECTCTPTQIARYMSRVSGPVMDRIDMHIEVAPVPFELMTAESLQSESSEQIRQRVIAARNIQTRRFESDTIHSNAMMESRHLKSYCKLDSPSRLLMNRAMERLGLSARAHDRILKVARTIADLAAKENIEADHIAEAIGYRSLDRSFWGVK